MQMGTARITAAVALMAMALAACGSGARSTGAESGADGVRVPTGSYGDDVHYGSKPEARVGGGVPGAPGSSDGGLGSGGPDGTDDLPLTDLGSAAVCGKNGVIDTGPVVQLGWAPRCVASGNATSPGGAGVSTSTIRIAAYITSDPKIIAASKNGGGCGESDCLKNYTRRYVDWFSSYYELHGRRVEIVFVTGGGAESDVTTARSDARRIAALDPPVFAAIGGPQEAAGPYAEELAAAKIVCVCGVSLPEEFYARTQPYVWGWLMSSSQAYLHRAEYVGARLAGRDAKWAGDSATRNKKRRFGLVWFDNERGDYQEGVEFFERELGRYGTSLSKKVRYENIEGCQINATNMIRQLKDAEVTSVIFSGDPICPISLTKAAQAQSAKWEWIVSGSIYTDVNKFARLYDQAQWSRAFGVSMQRPGVKAVNEYWYRMYKEIDPSGIPLNDARHVLEPLILFFSGVHLGGVNLTASSFSVGLLQSARTGGTVTTQRVSYGRETIDGRSFTDRTAVDDMTEIWWDPNVNGPDGSRGAYRYVARGKRYPWGGWPHDEPKAFLTEDTVTGFVRAPDQ